jgi:hypothetical protein
LLSAIQRNQPELLGVPLQETARISFRWPPPPSALSSNNHLHMKPVIDRPEPTRVTTELLRLGVWRAWYWCDEFHFGTVGKSYDRRCS